MALVSEKAGTLCGKYDGSVSLYSINTGEQAAQRRKGNR